MLSNNEFYPVGSEVFIIYHQLQHSGDDFLILLDNDQDLNRIELQLKSLIDSSRCEIILLPEWDINPYDRLSPSIKVQSSILKAQYQLATSTKQKIILATVSGLMYKFPAAELVAEHIIQLKISSEITIDHLVKKLIESGYQRSSTASDLGEFAVRGSIVDIIDNIAGYGIRIDFFGNKIESIRKFNPIDQVSIECLEEMLIFPASLVILNQQTIAVFQEQYKKLTPSYFNDSLYQAIKEMRRYVGLENWLPLFYLRMSSIREYLKSYQLVSCCDILLNVKNKSEEIKDGYLNRIKFADSKYNEEYVPVPVESLWLTEIELAELIKQSQSKAGAFTIKRPESFNVQARLLKTDPMELFRNYLTDSKKPIVVGFSSKAALARLEEKLQSYLINYKLIDKLEKLEETGAALVFLIRLDLSGSYELPGFIFIACQELINHKMHKPSSRLLYLEKIKNEISNYEVGDYVIHKSYGIARYLGIFTIQIKTINHDCLKLQYEDHDLIYLPVENIEYLSKYKDSGELVKLDKLGSLGWQNRKARVKNRIKEIALKLLEIAALRKNSQSAIFKASREQYEDFCNQFPYVETEDQQKAIEEIEGDLVAGQPMDRLLCGDVGFGKTEVAMRAAFHVASSELNPSQVVIIVPTTLLARQHYINFCKRFANTKVRIKQISRLVSSGEVKKVKQEIADGRVDIVIGTHALLAQDIKFSNLGLLIIDEEQHFGVKQKEKIKQLKSNCHVLALSATPIPRTLQMSIVGIKDLSLIATPPVERLSVKTHVLPHDYHIIKEAIFKEVERGGSVFYVVPRVEHIEDTLKKLDDLMPEIPKRAAHGQMKPGEIEEVMMDFYNRKFKILISTTIIESGIDLPFVNCMIIDRAEMFGLATLYQLRGRVGRGNVKASTYLITRAKKLTEDAKARLDVIHSLDHLGGGFTIASNDMDLRGYGNLLGEEQSGQIKEVGVELYQSMLAEAIGNLRDEKSNGANLGEELNPQINLGLPVFIPDHYIEDPATKLTVYRKAAGLENFDQIEHFADELIDRFGKFPVEVSNFILTLKIKAECKRVNIEKLDVGEKTTLISFYNNSFARPDALLAYIHENPGLIKIRGDQKILLLRHFAKIEERINYVRSFLLTLSHLVNN